MTYVEVYVEKDLVIRRLVELMGKISGPSLESYLRFKANPWLINRTRQRFLGQGDEVSGKWAPLKESTREFRINQGFSPLPINRRTGGMYDLLTQTGIPDAAATPVGAILLFPGPGGMKGYLKQKVSTAQHGKAKPGTVARPVLGLGIKDYAFFLRTLQEHVSV